MSLKNMTIEYNQEIKNNEREEEREKEGGRGRINQIKGKMHSILHIQQMFIVCLLGAWLLPHWELGTWT